MKKLLALVVIFMVGFAGTMIDGPSKLLVEGTVVDSMCFAKATKMEMPKAAMSDEHLAMKDGKEVKMPACGTACAKMGMPVGLLEGGKPDGKLYLIVGPAGGYADYMAHEIKVEGEEVYAGALMPSKLWVKKDGKWHEKPLPGTMM